MRQVHLYLAVKTIVLAIFFGLAAKNAYSATKVTGYLPLHQSEAIEADIERVFALSKSPVLLKPYKVADIRTRLAEVRERYPALYNRVSGYVARYENVADITDFSGQVAFSDVEGSASAIPNKRGLLTDNSIAADISGFVTLGNYMRLSVGAQYNDSQDLETRGSYLSVGSEYLQVDVGYRDHWFSPFHHGAMLASSHAPVSPSATISNSTGITDWNIRYEAFYSKLEPVEGIRLGNELYPGSPRLAGFHLSLSPTTNWSVGINRTLQFGGGERDVSFSDLLSALIDPAGKDNIDDHTADPNYEFGNQQASITTQLHLNIGVPLQLYAEYGGEDTLHNSNFRLGNQTFGLGVYLPIVMGDSSLRFEYNQWSESWYVHHLYPDGYTNERIIMGHWAAQYRKAKTAPGGNVLSISSDWQMSASQQIQARFSVLNYENTGADIYQTGYQVALDYYHRLEEGKLSMGLFISEDPLGNSTTRLELGYQW